MFVPIVPVVPHTTVVNKTIVYSNTVLTLKDLGNNLKVTSISDVGEFSLERCLKTIFESNPNVVFNTIQYSKSEEKVYFYTDTEISKKAWEDSKVSTYNPLTSSAEILEEVKKILLVEKTKNEDCVSLYDIAQLMKNKNYQCENMKKSYELHLNNKYNGTEIRVRGFDYDKSELRIGFGFFENYDEIRFSKKDGDLFVTQPRTHIGKNVLVTLGNILSKLYDEFIEYKDFEKQFNYGIKSVNSNFLIDISQYGVDIFTKSQSNRYMNDFKLSSYSYKNEWDYDCNSNTVINAFQGKENEIFKRIFVKISDCPEWSQPTLYEIRQNQLVEEQRIEDEQRNREMKKQKRLELTRKIFPFLKK